MSHVREHYGTLAERLPALYPHATLHEASLSNRELAHDRYIATLILWGEARAGQGARVYAYRSEHPVPTAPPPSWGTFHTGETPYVFGNIDTARRPYGAAERLVSRMMQEAWLEFMRRGAPDGAGLPPWPRATPAGASVMVLDAHPHLAPAVSSPERLQALRAYVAAGGALFLF